jgi:oligopeptide transport system substrate-binding protein
MSDTIQRKILTRRALVGAGAAAAVAGGTAFALRGSGSHARREGSDPKTLNRGNGAEPDSLDPHKALGGNWENNIIGDMFLGLMTEDAAGNPIFGAAESYHASAGGLTYTFRIRDHKWSDGVPVTADDFVFSFRRVLDPKTASIYAAILYPIRNAHAVNSGKMALDQLGVRAIDRRTLEIAFDFQVPYIAQLLTNLAAFAVPQHAVERYGSKWLRPGTAVTNGPYVLKEWVPNDRIRLSRNPHFYDAAQVRIENVNYYPTQDYAAALKRFRAGEFDLTNAVPAQEIDWLRANLPTVLHLTPYILTQYIQFNFKRKPFDDVRVRAALSLAIDREIITGRVMRAGEKPAYAYVPPDMPQYPARAHLPFKPMPMAQRILRAKELLKDAGFGPDNPLSFDYNFQNQTDARLTAVALQSMWKEIGVQVRLAPAESQVHYNLLSKQAFTVAWAGWVADYRDAKDYLFIWQSTSRDMNYGQYSNPKFDALVAKSDDERNAAARARLLVQAEQLLLDDVAMAPVYFGVSRNLVSTQVKGWIDNDINVNRSRYLSLDRSRLSA